MLNELQMTQINKVCVAAVKQINVWAINKKSVIMCWLFQAHYAIIFIILFWEIPTKRRLYDVANASASENFFYNFVYDT